MSTDDKKPPVSSHGQVPVVHIEKHTERLYMFSHDFAHAVKKDHRHVIDTVEKLLASKLDFSPSDFKKSTYRKNKRKYGCYKISHRGFMFLAISMVGDKGDELRLKFLDGLYDEKEVIARQQAAVDGSVVMCRSLCDAMALEGKEAEERHYINYHNLVSMVMFGHSVHYMKDQFCLDDKQTLFDALDERQQRDMVMLRQAVSHFLDMGCTDYQVIKKRLTGFYNAGIDVLEEGLTVGIEDDHIVEADDL